MKCADCKNFKKPNSCLWHDGAILHEDVLALDSAEKDCLGFERKAEVSR